MNKKQKFISVILTLFFSMFALIPSFEKNISAKEFPKKLYNVYLDGNHIGTINSKDRLYKYIDDDQIDLKEKYDIEEVYLPQNLYIEDYIGFESNLIDERKLYETIKDEKPFTVKGSIITIKKPKEDGSFDIKKINVLREEDYKKALENTIKTFIDENEYNVFFDGNTYTNFELGSTIEDIYIGDEALGNITIKRDALIPSDEYIFTDEKKLTHYLLFGTLEEQEKYIIKSGETIEQVAFDHKLGTKEFLIINPEFNSESNLLYEGQEVNVGQIATVVDVVKEEQLVEDFVTKFKTEIKYDSSKPYSFYEVTQEGENGLERVTKRIQYKNGIIANAKITNSEVIKPTVNRIEVRGSRISGDPIIIADAGNWEWPTKTPYMIYSDYGYRFIFGARDFHDGIDIITFPTMGSPVYAANDGNVVGASGGGYNSGRGAYIVINHNNGFYTAYYHLSKVSVTMGQAVTKGEEIGKIGNTGRSTGPHLHFGVGKGGPPSSNNSINPILLYR